MSRIFDTICGPTRIETGHYPNGALAVQLMTAEDSELVATLSVNLPFATDQLGEGEFFVKTWSENEFILKDAFKSGLFVDTGRRVLTDYVSAPIWRLR